MKELEDMVKKIMGNPKELQKLEDPMKMLMTMFLMQNEMKEDQKISNNLTPLLPLLLSTNAKPDPVPQLLTLLIQQHHEIIKLLKKISKKDNNKEGLAPAPIVK